MATSPSTLGSVESRESRAAHRRICFSVSVVCLGASAIGLFGRSLGLPAESLVPLGAIGVPYAIAWVWAVWRGDEPRSQQAS
ncbi:MAG TPA: hypothetical protein DCQ98_14590 [Planctomycetaceae bacterium]|nr:hypothetical protein [Planctomycetaceae bacterium]HRF02583.1 hypothetical protein [Pirellulaceae bacterium]